MGIIYSYRGCERFFYDANGNRIKHILPEYYDKNTDDGIGYEYVYYQAGHFTIIIDSDGDIKGNYM